MRLKDEDENLRKTIANLESLKPIYNVIKARFNNEDIRSVISRYDKLENYVTEFSIKNNELEDRIKELKEEIVKADGKLEHNEFKFREEEGKRNKIITNFRREIEQRDLSLKEIKNFEHDYYDLFNKVTDLYLHFAGKIHVWDGNNKFNLKPDLHDPIQMIDAMLRMIEITTPNDI
eukprot:CAMPEP_0114596682 /NCGR_PEP_ID=MMETSP0125-20121206/18812_1 /TAXON_ID=485358 ORGANISM="Aristerostoma sp., Strain ATCC 50986" /NCGR_SAMPLE_ID=MMETSP0125 /ASSEMBLY_ACC=CAM_ASM_000245 /LENGTH=175 /DNA_ID=CAMNT_0001800177 /DNA_START=211 /DNA_END=738 /DNA_ORIENTATION=+